LNDCKYLNERGEWAISPRFQNKGSFSDDRRFELSFNEGAAAIKVGDNYGFIDRQGKLFTPTNFKLVRAFDRGVANGAISIDRASLSFPHDLLKL
jgi:WG containing repeat